MDKKEDAFPFSLEKSGENAYIYENASKRTIMLGEYYRVLSVMNALEKAYRIGRENGKAEASEFRRRTGIMA